MVKEKITKVGAHKKTRDFSNVLEARNFETEWMKPQFL